VNVTIRYASTKVYFADGSRLRFDPSLSNDIELSESIQRMTVLTLLPAAKATIEAGKEVSFGPVSLNSRGITVQKGFTQDIARRRQFFPWSNVAKWSAGGGQLWLTDVAGKMQSIFLRTIPNYAVLLELLPSELYAK